MRDRKGKGGRDGEGPFPDRQFPVGAGPEPQCRWLRRQAQPRGVGPARWGWGAGGGGELLRGVTWSCWRLWIWGFKHMQRMAGPGEVPALRGGLGPPVPLLAGLTLPSTFAAGSGELGWLWVLLKARVGTGREPCNGAGKEWGGGGRSRRCQSSWPGAELNKCQEITPPSAGKRWLSLLKVFSAVVCNQHFE